MLGTKQDCLYGCFQVPALSAVDPSVFWAATPFAVELIDMCCVQPEADILMVKTNFSNYSEPFQAILRSFFIAHI